MNDTQKKWFLAAIIRAMRTMAQTAIATIGSAAILSEVSWVEVVSASLLAGIVSMLMSMAGLPEVDTVAKEVRYVSDTEQDAIYLQREVECTVDEGDGTVMIASEEEGEDYGTGKGD